MSVGKNGRGSTLWAQILLHLKLEVSNRHVLITTVVLSSINDISTVDDRTLSISNHVWSLLKDRSCSTYVFSRIDL